MENDQEILKKVQKDLDDNIHNKVVFIISDRYPELKNKYFFVTACLFEDENLIFGIINDESGWLTLRFEGVDGWNFIHKEIEICEGEQFDKIINKYKVDINDKISEIIKERFK